MDEWLSVPIAAPSSPPVNPPASPPQWPFASFQLERWLPWAVALAVAVAWFVSSRRSGDDGEPIQVDGLRVLIVEESTDRPQLPADQREIFTSVPVRELVAKLGGQIRILDADDSTDAMAAEWRAMRKRITTTPPAVVFAKPRRAVEMALPASVDQFREKLEGFAK
jgi:hypothetical protein